jgi:uncharacterized membrane protein
MAAKVLNAVVVAVGVVVVAVVAFIAVYVIGYSLFAILGHSGMGGGTARGVGAGITAIIAIVVLTLYLRSRRGATPATVHHGRGKHVA